MVECSFKNYVVVGSNPVPVTYILDSAFYEQGVPWTAGDFL